MGGIFSSLGKQKKYIVYIDDTEEASGIANHVTEENSKTCTTNQSVLNSMRLNPSSVKLEDSNPYDSGDDCTVIHADKESILPFDPNVVAEKLLPLDDIFQQVHDKFEYYRKISESNNYNRTIDPQHDLSDIASIASEKKRTMKC